MNDLIQSLPSPSPTAGITHTWMGESWMVDGETSVIMVMKISSKSPSRQGARTEFLVPNRGFWWWRRSGSLSGKNAEPPIVSGRRVYVGERGGSRRRLGWSHHPLARPGLGRAPWWWACLPAPLRLVFWLCGSSGKIGIFSIFWDFSWKSDFCTKTRHQGNSAENCVSPC
jgi:hypothetical protein